MERIAEHLLPHNRILWVGSVSMRRPRVRVYDAHRIVRRLQQIIVPRRQATSGRRPEHELNPFIVPFYDIEAVKVFNDAVLRGALRSRLRRLGFREVIVLTATPMVVDVVDSLNVSSSHYLCLDEYSCYDGAYKSIGLLEERMVKNSDTFFALSEPLMQKGRARAAENHFLPMGVDVEKFAPSNDSLPPAVAKLKKPIVGFFGQIGSYVDTKLIARCARQYPYVSFVLIGRAHVDIGTLMREPNVVFLGEIPYEEIPHYARAFDIGINPRVLNRLSISMNPLKILEYMSLGMPVVSTALPAVERFKDHVNIARSEDHFVSLVGEALRDRNPELRLARRAVAERFSWKSITENLSGIVHRVDLAKKAKRIESPRLNPPSAGALLT
jgi:glycosyltransferase involved in cell wall biosynthesis